MIRSRQVGFAVVANCAAAFLSAAVSPALAHADEASYLAQVQPRYVFLSVDQLRTEGYRVCAATAGGQSSLDAGEMVQRDLVVSVPVSMEIVAAARVHLDC
ncbi:MAG: DUF732 domain-containing protein [Mycobacterium sp.]